MNELTTWQAILVLIFACLIALGLLRIMFGLGDYLSNKANLYRAKLKVYKFKHREIFNKWYD